MEFWHGWSLFFNYQESKYENCSIFSESFFNCDRFLWLFYTNLSVSMIYSQIFLYAI